MEPTDRSKDSVQTGICGSLAQVFGASAGEKREEAHSHLAGRLARGALLRVPSQPGPSHSWPLLPEAATPGSRQRWGPIHHTAESAAVQQVQSLQGH